MSYDPFQEVNNLRILDVLDKLQIWYIKNWAWYVLKADDGRKDSSFSISDSKNIITDFWWSWIKWWVFDFVGQYYLKLSEAEMRTDIGRATTIKFFIDKWFITPPESTKEFVKSYNGKELLENFDELKLWGYREAISSFLITRWFTYEWIQKNKLKVWEIFANLWFYNNYYTTEKPVWQDESWKWCNEPWDEPKTVSVLLFPCYNELADLIWLKIRRRDWKTIRGKKSLAVWKTWLLYDYVSLDKQIIVEWETDYLVLKLLGFDNVVWNLWGVQSWRLMLKSLLSEASTVLCLYDNDTAWYNWKLALQATFKRPIQEIVYPIRKNNKWVALSDVNDYFEVGYDTKSKWEKIFLETSKNVWEEVNEKDRTDFIFLRSTLEYYDTNFKKIQQTWPVAAYLWQTAKELAKMVKDNVIKSYDDLCYHEWGKPWFYNTMDEEIIIKHWWDAEPILHPHIEDLINNICNNVMWNAEWLHKSILYKLTHINDPYIPALILYWFGWSGKGSLLNLLGKIFWDDNMQTGLGQKDLEWSFDSYQWWKLIVEYKEISSGNKRDDKKILDRIKSMLSEKTISVNAKFQNVRQVDNKARFHFSSNHTLPIQLDSKHSWNRRFTIIKTWWALDPNLAREMNETTFHDKQIIREYVAWLYDTFPEVVEMTNFPALENKEKRDLENSCEWVANLFFEWFENKYPSIEKITNKEKNMLLELYCDESWEDVRDARYKQSNFDLWLSHRYEKKMLKINWKTNRGYLINKTPYDKEHIATEDPSNFKDWEVDKMISDWNAKNNRVTW